MSLPLPVKSVFFVALILSCGIVNAEGGFANKCEDFQLATPNLKAKCPGIHCHASPPPTQLSSSNKQATQVEQSVINLDNYVTNNDGNLQWKRGGGFSKTVSDCYLRGPVIHCSTRTIRGGWRSSELNLNERIANNNGNLVYDGP